MSKPYFGNVINLINILATFQWIALPCIFWQLLSSNNYWYPLLFLSHSSINTNKNYIIINFYFFETTFLEAVDRTKARRKWHQTERRVAVATLVCCLPFIFIAEMPELAVENVVVHPLVLLSVVDHFNRSVFEIIVIIFDLRLRLNRIKDQLR